MLNTSLCISEYFPLSARTVIFKRPTFFWNTYEVIAFAWRTIYLQQCRFMPQFPLLSNPISFGTKISARNPSSQPSSCQCPAAQGCRPGPVPTSQLFLAGYITQGFYADCHHTLKITQATSPWLWPSLWMMRGSCLSTLGTTASHVSVHPCYRRCTG